MEEFGPIESIDERAYRFKQYVESLNLDLKHTLRHPHVFEPSRKYFVSKLADAQFGDAMLKQVLPLALGFQYAVTLHTKYRRTSSNVALELSADRASRDFKFFANRLNYSIFKNAYSAVLWLHVREQNVIFLHRESQNIKDENIRTLTFKREHTSG